MSKPTLHQASGVAKLGRTIDLLLPKGDNFAPPNQYRLRLRRQIYRQFISETAQEAESRRLTEDVDALLRDELPTHIPDFDRHVVPVVNQRIPGCFRFSHLAIASLMAKAGRPGASARSASRLLW
ncbi:hypothetical protein [Paraburkholderia nemoris]|uniref:hypothetical protein n=1 Tax=Paraburkholderia nemoris TaxID=2793076 RepID=UPI0038B708CF